MTTPTKFPTTGQSLPYSGRFSAITVTFNPPLQDGRLARQLEVIGGNADLHIIVDNASRNVDDLRRLISSQQRSARRQLIETTENCGIATALNTGVRYWLNNSNTEWVLLLDQDTCVEQESFELLGDELKAIPSSDKLGVVGFNSTRRRLALVSLANRTGDITHRHSVMSAGSFVARQLLEKLKFDESLFMYYVDVDFCHRVEQSGYSIVQLFRSRADVQEGRVVRWGGKEWSVLEPWRLYYVGRNGTRIFRRYHRLTDFAFAFVALAGNLLTNERGAESAVNFARGIASGFS
jgi:GT2 family glycosyltransferase